MATASLGRLTLDLVARTGTFTESMRQAGNTAVNESRRIENSLGTAIKSVGALGAAAVAGITVSSVIDAADGYTQMAAQIRNATADQKEYNKVQQHLLETANTTYRSLKEAQQVYLDVGGALKAYGATTEQALRITDSLSFSYTHNATAADKAASSTDAFMKSIYEGKVSGDSWRSMLSAIPSIVDNLSESMGKSKAEILSLGNAGKISIDDLKSGLDQSRESSEALANAMENSLKDGLTKVNNEFTKLVGELNMQYGITNNLAAGLGVLGEGLSFVGKNTDVVAVAVGVLATGYTLKMTPAIIASGKSFLVSSLEAIRYQATLAAMSAQATNTSMSLTLLSGAARGALAFLGGPVGLAVVAGSVAVSYYAMKQNTAEATAELERQASVADKTTKELLALNGAQKEGAKEDLASAFEKQNSELNKLNHEFTAVVEKVAFANKGNIEAQRVYNELRAKTIGLTEATARLNQTKGITGSDIKLVADAASAYEVARQKAQKNADAQKIMGVEAKLSGNLAENAARLIGFNTSAMQDNASAANNAANAQTNYQKSLSDRAYYAEYKRNLMQQHGFTEDLANEYVKLQEEAGGAGKRISQDAKNQAKETIASESQLKNYIESKRKAESEIENARKKSASDSLNTRKKEQQDAENLLKKQSQLRGSLSYEFSDYEGKMLLDYQKQISEIFEAGFSKTNQGEFLSAAKARYDAQKELYLANLAFERTEHNLNEEEKLNFQYQLNLREISLRNDLNDEDKKSFKKAAQEKHTQSMAWLQLEQAQRLNNAQSAFQSDIQRITSRYEFEREQIRLTNQYDNETKSALINASYQSQELENDSSRRAAWTEYQNEIGIDTNAEDEQSKRNKTILSALQWRLITQEEYQAQLLASEQKYHADRASLAFNSGESIAGSFSDMFKTIGGEQSSAYKAMFAIEKGFAIAQSVMAIQTGIANAMSLPFPANLGAAATVAMETANIVSTIQSISLVGMAHDGIANIPEEGTWLLNKGERVLNPQDNKAFTNMINNGGGGGDITIQVNVTDSGVSTSGGNTQDQRQLAQVIGNTVRAVIIQEKRQGGLLSK